MGEEIFIMLVFNIYFLSLLLPFSLHPHEMCLLKKKNACVEVISIVSVSVYVYVYVSM